MIPYSFHHHCGVKMLRTLVLVIILFIPGMSQANQKEPYFYRMKPGTRIGTQENKSYSRAPYEYTFTAKPVTEPVHTKTVTEPRFKETYMIPAYILKSLELNENMANDHAVKIKKLFSNIRPNQIEKIPVAGENLVDIPIEQDFHVPPEKSYQHQLQIFRDKDRLSEENFLPHYRVTKYSTPLPITVEEVANKPVNELTLLTDSRHYNSQLPVLTEKPVYDQNFLLNNEEGRITNLPALRKPFYVPNAQKERLLRGKLLTILFASRKDVEKHMKNTKSIHDTFKSGTMYKIGYITSLINKMNNRIRQLYNTVQNNQYNWDSLKILEAYEQLKKGNEMIQQLLSMMQSYLRIKEKTGIESLKGGAVLPTISAISWSYYDDNLI